MRRQLGITSRTPGLIGVAHVFNLQRNLLVSTLLIDQGKSEGVEVGMTVVAGGNILIGKITEVFEHSSRVMIADDPRAVISVRIIDTDLLVESRGNLQDTILLY